MISIFVGLLMSVGFASTSIQIDSFVFVDRAAYLAELCGTVVGDHQRLVPVKITVDPNTNRPGSYVAHSDSSGKFCQVLVTYSGRAAVGFLSSSNSADEKEIETSVK